MKSKIWYVTKLLILAVVINLLLACTDSGGNDISIMDWWFAPSDDGGANVGNLLTAVGAALGGPWGYALAGAGAATGPVYKWFHHDKSATGLIKTVQAARAALPDDARKVFDDTSREVMNNAKTGNLRAYVRTKKEKMRRSGKLALEKFSDKHSLQNMAKKTVAEILKE